MCSRGNSNKEQTMAISKLREIIDRGYNIKNIQSLPVTPKMYARDLQAKFDQNVDALVNAIDDPNGLIDSITQYIADVASSIVDPGGSDTLMTQAVFATGINPSESEHPVDRALYANTVNASVVDGILYLGTTPQ